jgi:acyl carrier protein
MRESQTESTVRQFLLTDVLYDRALKDLAMEESLLEGGLLDSLGILRTVTFCEEHFGITIPDEEVLPENFENVRAIARLVERCHAKRP